MITSSDCRLPAALSPRLTCRALLLGFLLLTYACCPAHSEAPSGGNRLEQDGDTNSGPRIQFSELIHDFGKVDSGTVITNEYVFTNAGNRLLEVREVRPGCGCTAAASCSRRRR